MIYQWSERQEDLERYVEAIRGGGLQHKEVEAHVNLSR
jgi:hypothetical protein